MSEGVIKISKEAVAATKSDIRLCADNFAAKAIDFNIKSNITAVETAKSSYLEVCNSISKLSEFFRTNAMYIEQMGESFDAIDERIAKKLATLLAHEL